MRRTSALALAMLACGLRPTSAGGRGRSLLVVKRRNIAVGASASGLGDAIAQWLEDGGGSGGGRALFERREGSSALDERRLRNAALLGGVWAGACSPQVYALGEWLLPGRSVLRVLGKVGISCGILSTGGNWINMFVRRVGTGEVGLGEAAASTNEDLFWGVVCDDLRVWPLYDVVCFALIPPAVRPAATACVNAAWATYISLVAAREQTGA